MCCVTIRIVAVWYEFWDARTFAAVIADVARRAKLSFE